MEKPDVGWDLRSGGERFVVLRLRRSGYAGSASRTSPSMLDQHPGVTFNHLVMIDNFVNIQNTRRRSREAFALPGGTAT